MLDPLLNHGSRALIATVAGQDEAIRGHYATGLAAGVAPAALAEIARMAHLFCGFPRAIQGLKALGEALTAAGRAVPEDPEPGMRDRNADRIRGEGLFRRIYAGDSNLVLSRLDQPASGFAAWVLEDAYGRVLCRPGLTPAQRETLAVAALAALRCPAPLKSHVRGALRLGVTAQELLALVVAIGPAVGAEAAAEVRALIESLVRTDPSATAAPPAPGP